MFSDTTYMLFHIFLSLISHCCSITNCHIGHGTLQKLISSKLSHPPWHSWHSLLLVYTCIFKQGGRTAVSSILAPSMLSWRRKKSTTSYRGNIAALCMSNLLVKGKICKNKTSLLMSTWWNISFLDRHSLVIHIRVLWRRQEQHKVGFNNTEWRSN